MRAAKKYERDEDLLMHQLLRDSQLRSELKLPLRIAGDGVLPPELAEEALRQSPGSRRSSKGILMSAEGEIEGHNT